MVYGWFTFAIQYALLFSAIHIGMFAGLAALIYQFQIFINIGLAYFFFNERVDSAQYLGILIAFAGIGIVSVHALKGNVTFLGFCLTILAPTAWAFGNMASKKAGNINVVSLVIWGNFISILPIAAMGLCVEGPQRWADAWHHLTWSAGLATAYIVYLSTLIGFSLWSWLISLYPVKTVVPFMLLVPPMSMVAAFFILGEPLYLWEFYAAVLILFGLAINFFGDRFIKRFKLYRKLKGISP